MRNKEHWRAGGLRGFTLVLAGAAIAVASARGDQRRTLLDFGAEEAGVEMGITDDGVMGGLSKGRVERTEQGTILFSGTLSLENNGGFSSLRMEGGDWNLEGWDGIMLADKNAGPFRLELA